jgi:hypothetical protein
VKGTLSLVGLSKWWERTAACTNPGRFPSGVSCARAYTMCDSACLVVSPLQRGPDSHGDRLVQSSWGSYPFADPAVLEASTVRWDVENVRADAT